MRVSKKLVRHSHFFVDIYICKFHKKFITLENNKPKPYTYGA